MGKHQMQHDYIKLLCLFIILVRRNNASNLFQAQCIYLGQACPLVLIAEGLDDTQERTCLLTFLTDRSHLLVEQLLQVVMQFPVKRYLLMIGAL